MLKHMLLNDIFELSYIILPAKIMNAAAIVNSSCPVCIPPLTVVNYIQAFPHFYYNKRWLFNLARSGNFFVFSYTYLKDENSC